MAVDVLTLSILLVIHSIIAAVFLLGTVYAHLVPDTIPLLHTDPNRQTEQTTAGESPAPSAHRRPSQRGFVLHEP
jgi:hypothetical protein